MFYLREYYSCCCLIPADTAPAQRLAVDNEHGLTCFNYQLNTQFIYSIIIYITL